MPAKKGIVNSKRPYDPGVPYTEIVPGAYAGSQARQMHPVDQVELDTYGGLGDLLSSANDKLFREPTWSTPGRFQPSSSIPLNVPPPPVLPKFNTPQTNIKTETGNADKAAAQLKAASEMKPGQTNDAPQDNPKVKGAYSPKLAEKRGTGQVTSTAKQTKSKLNLNEDSLPEQTRDEAPSSPSVPSQSVSPPAPQPVAAFDPRAVHKALQDPMLQPRTRMAMEDALASHYEMQAAQMKAANYAAQMKSIRDTRMAADAHQQWINSRKEAAATNARQNAGWTGEGFKTPPPQDPAAVARGQKLLSPESINAARSQTENDAISGVDSYRRAQQFGQEYGMKHNLSQMGLNPDSPEAANLQRLSGNRMPDQHFQDHQRDFPDYAPLGPDAMSAYHNTQNLGSINRGVARPELGPTATNRLQSMQDDWMLRQKRAQAGADLVGTPDDPALFEGLE